MTVVVTARPTVVPALRDRLAEAEHLHDPSDDDAQEDDADAKEVADNLAVLRALGASAWSEGDTGHAKVRLALK